MTGPVTADGCAVEVYRRLPAGDDAALVHRLAGPGARVLDLGAGTGRIADPLVARGHDVLAVDGSADMLACVRQARTHAGRIEDLHLGERFDAVVLASHLVNTEDDGQRAALLAAARRHLVGDGRLLLQWHEPAWFDGLRPGDVTEGPLGPFTCRLEVHDLAAGVLTATVSYTEGPRSWRQAFRARRLGRAELAAALADAGLELQPGSPAPTWLVAVAR